VNGLPEATVEDLAIFSDGTLRLLRAAIAARGVWELRLDAADVADLTYVRVHEDDLRYRIKAVEKQRDLVTARSWHASPDVRPRPAPAPPPTPPGTLPWFQGKAGIDAELLRRFQAALRASKNDRRVRATGVWDSYFNEVLRDLGAPTMPASAAPPSPFTIGIDQAFWNQQMSAHGAAEPWSALSPADSGTPTEADLYELVSSLKEGDFDKASCSLPAGSSKVDVVAHYRGLGEMAGAHVRVTLLWWTDPAASHRARWDNVLTWPTIKPGPPTTVGWTAAVNEVLNSTDGRTTQTVDGGWNFALGSNAESHRLILNGQTLDAMRSGVATFDLNLTGLPSNTLVLLVAIVHSVHTPGASLALTPANLRDLTLTNSGVAVRSVRIT
jgi:hypothetical protein